ncbi:hypothetical protein FOH38_23515 [Lysinibacillus fusiformis]|nr:hypothetical protein FOH38_23515 [Lysinibacillus fusiformis]
MTQIMKFLNDGGIVIKSYEGIYAHKTDTNSLPLILDKEAGEQLFAEAKEMFVFRMDDYQWIAHYSEEEALAFYHEQTGVTMDDLKQAFDDWGEVPLTDTMFWEASDITDEEANMAGVGYEGQTEFGDCYKVTFDWVIQNRTHKYPGYIACTE